MAQDERLENIPRGDTCAGVNRAVIEHLLAAYGAGSNASLLDVPCGKGIFLSAIQKFFRSWQTHGADIQPPDETGSAFTRIDAGSGVLFDGHAKFDIVTCISGVMEFDNTLAFFKNIKGSLSADGLLIVTNDNILTVRDRLLYLFAGRFAQYPFSTSSEQPTWKILPLQNLIRILGDAGFKIIGVKYVPVRPADWLWSPVAVLLYALTLVFPSPDPYRSSVTWLRSYLSRHYLLICRPTAAEL